MLNQLYVGQKDEEIFISQQRKKQVQRPVSECKICDKIEEYEKNKQKAQKI